jgi:hypothetical protein
MKFLLNGVLCATSQESSSLKQLIVISRDGKLELQSKLRSAKMRGAVGGLPGALCSLSSQELQANQRVIFFENSAEYTFLAISSDPDLQPSISVQGK